MRRSLIPLATTAAGLTWILFLIFVPYSGHASGLFYTGLNVPLPPELEGHTLRVADPSGYDAQFYHLMAHDPLNRRGFASYVDNPSLRWRRIGIPGLAWLFAGGKQSLIDYAYIAIEVAALAVGTLWLGQWGWGLLLIPATPISLDRMTVDLPLVVVTLGILRFADSGWVYLLAGLAPFVRETGLVCSAGVLIWLATQRKWRRSLLVSASVLPATCWYTFVHFSTASDGTAWSAVYPFSGLIERTLSGPHISGTTLWLRLAAVSEQLALLGYWMAMLLAFWYVIRRHDLPEWIALCVAIFFCMLGRGDIWESVYAAGRTLSPLLLALGFIAKRDSTIIPIVPALLILPRIALQYAAEIMKAVHGLAA